MPRTPSTTHGEASRGHGNRSAEYETWASIIKRCTNPKFRHFARYGGRGITVCERWRSYENFLADMGRKPSPAHSIERVDNDRGYEPDNCLWVTDFEQANNKRNNRWIEAFGTRMTASQWSHDTGVPVVTILARLRVGESGGNAVLPHFYDAAQFGLRVAKRWRILMPRLSPQELAERSRGLGSTCIVEACGLAPWKGAGPMRLMCEKLGIAPPDDAEEDDEDDKEWLEWGHVQEPVIADFYERTRGVKLQLGGPVYSREIPNFWATLDRTVIGASKLIEVKNVGSPRLYSHWDTSSSDGCPRYVRAQVTIAMAYHGARECDVVAAIGGRPPHVWTVTYDPELAELLIDGGRRFWALVQSRTPPPLDHTPASKAYLLDKYPSNADRIIHDATEGETMLAVQRIQAANAEKEAKREKDRLDAELMSKIGDRAGIRGFEWKMTWKLNKSLKRQQRFTARGEPE